MAVDTDANQAIWPALLAPYAFLLGLPHTSIQPLSIHPEGIFSFHLIDLPGNIFYNFLFLSSGLYTSLDTTSMSSFNFPNTSFFSSLPAPPFRQRLIRTPACSALLMLLKSLPQQEPGPPLKLGTLMISLPIASSQHPSIGKNSVHHPAMLAH